MDRQPRIGWAALLRNLARHMIPAQLDAHRNEVTLSRLDERVAPGESECESELATGRGGRPKKSHSNVGERQSYRARPSSGLGVRSSELRGEWARSK